jgi:hypothetical protein
VMRSEGRAQRDPGDLLLSLLRRCRLSRREQAIIIAVLLAQRPITAREAARRTGLAYSHAKAVIRGLMAWGILTRTPAGLSFEAEPSHWGPPMVPRPPKVVETDRPQKAAREG